jgi:hypothetical protein
MQLGEGLGNGPVKGVVREAAEDELLAPAMESLLRIGRPC